MAQDDVIQPVSVGKALVVTGLVTFAVVSWIVIGAYGLHYASYFAPLVLGWYWVTIGRSEFGKLAPAFVGAISGLAVVWVLRTAPAHLGLLGLILAILATVALIFVDVIRWAPFAVNGSSMLFLTVGGIPAVIKQINFVEVGVSLTIGTLYFAAIVWAARRFGRWRADRAPAGAPS